MRPARTKNPDVTITPRGRGWRSSAASAGELTGNYRLQWSGPSRSAHWARDEASSGGGEATAGPSLARARTRTLRDYPASDLGELLEAEASHWQRELQWDYAEVSQAVATGLDKHSLAGRVLEDGARPVAYCYYMRDADRAIVGSLFALADYRGEGLEEQLLDEVLWEAQNDPVNRRVECQTLFSTTPLADARFAAAGFTSRPRHYLHRELAGVPQVPSTGVRLRHLRKLDLASAARIIHASHQNTADAVLNTTYATPRHCKAFVETVVLRNGCGQFDAEASFLAEDAHGPVAVLLSSRLAPSNGHICQVSVDPQAQGRGYGSELLAAALDAMRRSGVAASSLSVTVGNRPAYRLYERFGFGLRRGFAAHAWARPPERIELKD